MCAMESWWLRPSQTSVIRQWDGVKYTLEFDRDKGDQKHYSSMIHVSYNICAMYSRELLVCVISVPM